VNPVTNSRRLSEFERRKRDLPHWEEPGATYFIRFAVRRASEVDLTQCDVASIIIDALRHFDGVRYWLYDYTVMPDHVHAILKPIVREGKTEYLWSVMRSLKGWAAPRINAALKRSGPLWRDETYDHIIRDQAEYERCAGAT
jgi:putative transposase